MRWFILFVLTLQTAMCGQKGPLYLPEKTLGAPMTAQDQPSALSGPRIHHARS